MNAVDDLSFLHDKRFFDAVQKFEELLAQSGRTFLLGAGCSKCAGLPLTAELTKLTLQSSKLDNDGKAILEAIKSLFAGADSAHIEDYLSELVDLLAIADRRKWRGAAQAEIQLAGKGYSSEHLKAAAEQIKLAIAELVGVDVKIEIHKSFIRSIHRPLRAGLAVPNSVVDYLVLNYDTLIEDALALERVAYADGIDGGVTGWWNPDTFNRDGLAARVLKLHGSVNWYEVDGDTLPRRIAPNLLPPAKCGQHILIWPASTKYRETQLDPFAQLADQARRAMRPYRGSQRVLVICGYSFGDSHINIEIDRALRESSGDLTVVAFTSDDEPVGQLKSWHQSADVQEQVLIYAKRGFFHGREEARSTEDLPWWKFENIVRLLGGER